MAPLMAVLTDNLAELGFVLRNKPLLPKESVKLIFSARLKMGVAFAISGRPLCPYCLRTL